MPGRERENPLNFCLVTKLPNDSCPAQGRPSTPGYLILQWADSTSLHLTPLQVRSPGFSHAAESLVHGYKMSICYHRTGSKNKKIPLWKKNFPRNCLKQVKYHPQKGTYLLEYKPMVWLDRDLWSSDWQVRGHLTISAVFTFFWSFHNSVIT